MYALKVGEMKRRRRTCCISRLLVNHSLDKKWKWWFKKQDIQETIHSYILNKIRRTSNSSRGDRQGNQGQNVVDWERDYVKWWLQGERRK